MVLTRWRKRKKQSKLEDLDMGLCPEYQVPVNSSWLNSRAGSNQHTNLLAMTEGHGWQWLQTCTEATRRLVAAGLKKNKRQTHKKSPQQSHFFDYRVVWNCDFQLLPLLISKNSLTLSSAKVEGLHQLFRETPWKFHWCPTISSMKWMRWKIRL